MKCELCGTENIECFKNYNADIIFDYEDKESGKDILRPFHLCDSCFKFMENEVTSTLKMKNVLILPILIHRIFGNKAIYHLMEAQEVDLQILNENMPILFVRIDDEIITVEINCSSGFMKLTETEKLEIYERTQSLADIFNIEYKKMKELGMFNMKGVNK